ncbi:MAG: hypothetical protein OEV45_13620 [Desulfobacteraceae bacterium]|nr:hypothetical protein [Desulfobacteraceae bacterium]
MKFKNLFRSKTKKKAYALSQILNGEHDEWDNPNFVYLASEIISEYGAILEQTPKLVLGVCEKRLPYHKREIEAAIELLLKFLNNKELWIKLKKKYPKTARTIITDKYYNALRVGYVELAKFVPDNEGKLCESAYGLLKGEITDEVKEEIKSSWFEEVIQINQRIIQESSSRLKILHHKFGKEDNLF